MGELIVIRHAQARFGSAEAGGYDRLSAQGEVQAAMLGAALKSAGLRPDRLVAGSLERQKKTMEIMAFDGEVEEHAGFDEYDFHDLLQTRFGGNVPDDVVKDRREHFRTLRTTLQEWQAGGLAGAAESWAAYKTRVQAARAYATRPGAQCVLAVSSGGTIGRLVAQCLQAPEEMMITLNLQVKNTSITRFIFSDTGKFFLHEFNVTPHFFAADTAPHLTYS